MVTFPPPLTRRRFFTDSSAHLALLDRDDQHHREASAILAQLAHGRYRAFMTNVLIIEAHALILSKLGIAAAIQFLRDIDASATVIVRVRALDEE